ncbi:MAG TPA: response regulator transcription factor [Clostridiales bacterium]|jgi:DNA-binding response OmpR family regulator|nr:response regulator transcription factor [Clostridiales bacterium]
MNILICDDDVAILNSIEIYLKMDGYNTLKAQNGKEALDLIENNEVHLVILDVMMPVLDGIETIRRIREKYNIPVIMLSAKSEDTDKILGLGLGADDYVTKPFSPLELMARVKSQVRRYTSLGAAPISDKNIIVIDGLVIDKNAKKVTVDGDEVYLTATEYKILEYLADNAGMVLTTGQIYEAVWNEPSYYTEKTVTVHIARIREKIEIDTKNPKYLKVVWGLGYKIEKN